MKRQPESSREHIVRARSEDGFRLDGVLIEPRGAEAKPNAIVWVHGLYSAFYHSPGIEIGRALAARGYVTLIGNTRGHNFGAAIINREGLPRCAGGGWERYKESPRDIAGWIDFAADEGLERIVLVGHSLGARKAVYYQAERNDRRVRGLVAASPGMAFLDEPDEEFDRVLERARRMVAEGEGRELVGWPRYGCSISAATLVEGEGEFQNIFFTRDDSPTAVSRVQCPILALYGSEEKPVEHIRIAFDTIRRNATARVDSIVIEGADHIYSDCEEEAARVIAQWSDGF
ncbi:MAG: alpha/beta fold hydrolase [Acidobacteriota bacterium]